MRGHDEFKKHTSVITCAAIVLSGSVVMVSAEGAANQQPHSSSASSANDRTIRGVWRTAVTPYNCDTGQPIVTLSGLFTFNQGGIMAEYGIGPGSSPALRSPGHGVWQRERGWHEYSFEFTFYRYSANGVHLGSQKVTAALELDGNGNGFASRSRIEMLDVNDNLVGRGCATTLGTRFE